MIPPSSPGMLIPARTNFYYHEICFFSVMSSCPAMKQAQFDGNVQSQQRHAASREPAALTGQNDERLRNENKEAITAAAKGLQNAGDILQSKHGEKLQVIRKELF